MDLEHNSPADEILIAGHSSGSFVLAMLAAELRPTPDAEILLQKVSLLTLGKSLKPGPLPSCPCISGRSSGSG